MSLLNMETLSPGKSTKNVLKCFIGSISSPKSFSVVSHKCWLNHCQFLHSWVFILFISSCPLSCPFHLYYDCPLRVCRLWWLITFYASSHSVSDWKEPGFTSEYQPLVFGLRSDRWWVVTLETRHFWWACLGVLEVGVGLQTAACSPGWVHPLGKTLHPG